METTPRDSGSPTDRIPYIEIPGDGDLVAFGGQLTPSRLENAYTTGIFPWYEDNSPVLWWSPDPRAILEFEDLEVSRRLARTVRSGRFEVTRDRDFAGVIRGCAEARSGETWITQEMIDAYVRFHRLGRAHSVEVWRQGRLVGGIYGVSIGGFFAGESMFYRERDASKVGLVFLVEHLKERGYSFLDLQILNEHTEAFGGIEIPRVDYLDRLEEATRMDVDF